MEIGPKYSSLNMVRDIRGDSPDAKRFSGTSSANQGSAPGGYPDGSELHLSQTLVRPHAQLEVMSARAAIWLKFGLQVLPQFPLDAAWRGPGHPDSVFALSAGERNEWQTVF